MEFIIRKNSTLPLLKIQVVKDGRGTYEDFMSFIETSTIYFSMQNIDTGHVKINTSYAGFVEKIFDDPNTPPEYYLYYRFSKKDTNKIGRYEGQFLLKNDDGTLILPIREKLNILIKESLLDDDLDYNECFVGKYECCIIGPPSFTTPTPTQTPTITPSITPTLTLTVTPTQTNTPTNTETPTNTPSNTNTPTPTNTPSITPTNTTTPTSSITPSITQTSTPTITPSSSPIGGGIVSDSLFMKLEGSDYSGSGQWLDGTVNGNNGTVNGATYLPDYGGIFDFDGVNNTISVAHTSNLSLSTTQQRTVQVWVRFDEIPALNNQIPVFGKLSSLSGFDGYWGGLFSNGGVVRVTTNGTGSQKVSDSTLTINSNIWYLFTFISQITSALNTTKVYINETEYISTQHGNDTYNESNPFYLGFIGSGVGSLYLNGKIGACYFYTKGLNTSEISQNYNNTKNRYI